MKDVLWKIWDMALDGVDWVAEKIGRHPRKVIIIILALGVLAVLP